MRQQASSWLYNTANRFGVASRSLGILIGATALILTSRAANAVLSSVPAATIIDDPLEEVVVQGHYELFSDAATGYTNLPLPMEKIPQSIGIVDADLLKAADLKTLADVAGRHQLQRHFRRELRVGFCRHGSARNHPRGEPDRSLQELKTLTLSTQSVIEVVDHWSILLGAAHSRPSLTNTFDDFRRDDHLPGDTILRTAVIYEFAPHAYASYSQSFNPQFLGDQQDRVLAPLTGSQYEIGVKYRPSQEHLLVTAAAFVITQKNAGQFVDTVDGIDRYQPIGELRHRGIQLTALGHVTSSNEPRTTRRPKYQGDGYATRGCDIVGYGPRCI
jgi:outer membrane receptor for ferric coprogen and ferric-rhodotorulic acid